MQTQINTLEQAMLSIQQMPVNAQQQIFNYIFEMQYKQAHQTKKMNSSKDIPSDIEKTGNFAKFAGILTSDKHVTIEEMNKVIKRRGARLDCD